MTGILTQRTIIAVETALKSEYPKAVSNNRIREITKAHQNSIDKILSRLVVDGKVTIVTTSNGLFYQWIMK